jgi:hypothetical protein
VAPAWEERGLRTRKSFNNRVKVAVLASVAGALLLWLTWPTGGQLRAETCAPSGLIAELSASIHGGGFWRVQLEDIRNRRDEAENWDRTQAEKRRRISEVLAQSDEVVRTAKQQLAKIYREHPNLAPSQEDQLANQMRARAEQMSAQADTIELAKMESVLSEKMRKKLPVLQRCETLIREKLR